MRVYSDESISDGDYLKKGGQNNMSLQPKPDSKNYTDLISEIQKGHIKIPKFQRNFVWSLDKTAELLDSILKGYPIGTFILWETNEKLNDIKNIGNIELPATQKMLKFNMY